MSGRSARPMTVVLRTPAATAVCVTPITDILPFVGHRVSYVAYRLKYDRAAVPERRSGRSLVSCIFAQAAAYLRGPHR